MKTCLQFFDTAADEREARAMLTGYLMQDSCVGARVIEPGGKHAKWSVQAFVEDDPTLPAREVDLIGAKRVVLPPSLEAELTRPRRRVCA